MGDASTSVAGYLKGLPVERRALVEAVRRTILDHLPEGYVEVMQYGMIGYAVPIALYPAGYHARRGEPLPYVALGNQKHHVAVHLFGLYADPKGEAWLRATWARTGKRLDMGKGCVRFRSLDDVPVDALGAAVARLPVRDFIDLYEAGRASRRSGTRNKAASRSM
jgi:hypothetical protein